MHLVQENQRYHLNSPASFAQVLPAYHGVRILDQNYILTEYTTVKLTTTLSVPLGSIPELPAKSCQEIKANEEGQVVSGKYWFYSIIPGTSVFAYCSMLTEGMLKS